MSKKDMNNYVDYILDVTTRLLAIDSPTGFTDKAAEWVLEAILKHSARIRNMGRFKAKSEPFRLRFAFCHYSLGKSFIMSVQTRLLQSYS